MRISESGKTVTIHVWVPDYASAMGGIQTFSRLFVRALRDIYPNASISVFAKNDTSFPDTENDPADHFTLVGWWSLLLRTPVFAAELFWRGIWERPDFVAITHVNFTPVAEALQKACRIPYLAVGHGIEVWDLPGRRIPSALRKADVLLAVSEFTRQKMAAALGLPSHRIQVLPNTFEAEQFAPAVKAHFLLKRYHLRPDQPVILTIARLASAERYKGYDQILRVLPKVRELMPDVHYILGGKGPDKARIESLIAELGLEDSVTLAGYVPDHELSAHYNLCDVFAMPSKGEGFGIVFLEALACGKAVIAGNKDGSADALQNGALGVLIDPDNLQELGDTIVAVLAEVESRKAKVESRPPTSDLRSPLPALTSDIRPLSSGPHIPEIVFQPEELREKVIEYFGFERFKERLHEILAPLLKRL
ncbi:MAG: glycosyltransferase family 4 protein [Bryobacteraceae bacterium]